MPSNDSVGTLVPYLKVNEVKLGEFHALCDRFVEKTRTKPGCVHYAFSFSGDAAHCREGYDDAAGLLAHLDNVGAVLGEALKIATITKLEVHGPAAEPDKLRGPMAALNPQWFPVEMGLGR